MRVECWKDAGLTNASSKALRVRIGPKRKVVSDLAVKLACSQVMGTALKASPL